MLKLMSHKLQNFFVHLALHHLLAQPISLLDRHSQSITIMTWPDPHLMIIHLWFHPNKVLIRRRPKLCFRILHRPDNIILILPLNLMGLLLCRFNKFQAHHYLTLIRWLLDPKMEFLNQSIKLILHFLILIACVLRYLLLAIQRVSNQLQNIHNGCLQCKMKWWPFNLTTLGPWYLDLITQMWSVPNGFFGPSTTLMVLLSAISVSRCSRFHSYAWIRLLTHL